MRLRLALTIAATAGLGLAYGDDPPKPPTVDAAVAKSAEARKKVAAAKAEQEAADKALKEVLAALNLQLKDLGLDPVSPDPTPTPPGPTPPGPKPADPDVAKLQEAMANDKTEAKTRAEKLAKLAAVYRMAVKSTLNDKDEATSTAADILGIVRDAVATTVDEGDAHYLMDLRRAIADVFVNPKLKTIPRSTPLTDDERKRIAAVFEAVAAAVAQVK